MERNLREECSNPGSLAESGRALSGVLRALGGRAVSEAGNRDSQVLKAHGSRETAPSGEIATGGERWRRPGLQGPSRERVWTQQREERGAGDCRRVLGTVLRALKPLGHSIRPSRPLGAHSAQIKGGEVCPLPTPPPFPSEGGMEGGGEKEKTGKEVKGTLLRSQTFSPSPLSHGKHLFTLLNKISLSRNEP